MKQIALGMVGGGQGAFIGGVHRIAARLDGRFRLIAGALSSTPERSAASAAELGLERSYGDWAEMARDEAARPDGIEAVAIVTPNHMHFGPAKAFLEAGIHVICDKPMTVTLDEALELKAIADRSDALLVLTHTYAGYPMLREARRLVASGALGKLRLVNVEYLQDWLAEPETGKQAAWRGDPKQAGTGAIGDIGTHAAHLARFVTGLPIEAVSAEMHSFVEGRQVDDNIHVMLRMAQGVRGMLWASQVSVGFDNDLRLRVVGDKAGMEWCHDRPEELRFTRLGEPTQILTRGGPGYAGKSRVPGGHPEGFLEAFASIYADAADAIAAGALPEGLPGVEEGVQGLRFIDACLRSNADDGRWTQVEE
jgi:predicted dehydrogenase